MITNHWDYKSVEKFSHIMTIMTYKSIWHFQTKRPFYNIRLEPLLKYKGLKVMWYHVIHLQTRKILAIGQELRKHTWCLESWSFTNLYCNNQTIMNQQKPMKFQTPPLPIFSRTLPIHWSWYFFSNIFIRHSAEINWRINHRQLYHRSPNISYIHLFLKLYHRSKWFFVK